MFVGTINKGISLAGYFKNKLLEVHNIRKRHDELVKEMEERGMKHKSELPTFNEYTAGEVDREANLVNLYNRCEECRKRK